MCSIWRSAMLHGVAPLHGGAVGVASISAVGRPELPQTTPPNGSLQVTVDLVRDMPLVIAGLVVLLLVLCVLLGLLLRRRDK